MIYSDLHGSYSRGLSARSSDNDNHTQAYNVCLIVSRAFTACIRSRRTDQE